MVEKEEIYSSRLLCKAAPPSWPGHKILVLLTTTHGIA